ncbi:MAG: aminomethyl-transferring glycine dehydrogenase subunit GcvPA [Christensenellales bacterium]|jgi:glycine dehydrogenase subunit 1
MGSYIPSTEHQVRQMLDAIGVSSVEDLFQAIPDDVRLSRPLDLPAGASEMELGEKMRALAEKNTVFQTVLRGAGAYRHYIPAIVKYVTAKEEFVTAYTPYQAEISQGILQSIFEYQTMICSLTGMDVSNASVYDGASAAAEAAAMVRTARRDRALVSAAAHPDVIATMRTYVEGAGGRLDVIPAADGATDLDALRAMIDETVSCVYAQQPNFFGIIEDAEALGACAHEGGAKFVMGVNPISLALLKTPADCGADIAVGEGQPLGMPLSYGGPYLGFMAAKSPLMRKLPGRIVGQTTDAEGKRAFVLTLQAREQHIRREKASSNICSNQALCAMTAAVYMAAMGASGMAEVARQCVAKAHYLADRLCEIDGVERLHAGEFFHEFATSLPVPAETVLAALERAGILGGLPIAGGVLWCVTEMVGKDALDAAVEIVRAACRA